MQRGLQGPAFTEWLVSYFSTNPVNEELFDEPDPDFREFSAEGILYRQEEDKLAISPLEDGGYDGGLSGGDLRHCR